jgi:hypothetical protein
MAKLGLRIVSVAILGRLLTPQEYGIVAGALIAMDLAEMVYGMGLAPTLIQRKDVRPDHVATAFSSALVIAVLAGAGMWVTAPLIADAMQIPDLTQVVKVLAWLTPLGAFTISRSAACPSYAIQERGARPWSASRSQRSSLPFRWRGTGSATGRSSAWMRLIPS